MQKKTAETSYPLHDTLSERWSPRAFRDEHLTDEELGSLLEAARWSASCFNEQPWRFLVGTRGTEAWDKLLAVLVEFNQGWARTAPVLMLSVARTGFTHNDKPNQHAWHDVGLASASMALQAQTMGISMHMMGGFDAEAARTSFAIPEGYEPVAAIAIGREGDPDQLGEELASREREPRKRRPLEDQVFEGSWEKRPSFLGS